MADFSEAIKHTLWFEDARLEGKVTTDKGGRTRFGIAEKFNADMPESFYTTMSRELALNLAIDKYKRKYWAPKFGELNSQELANKVFDCVVNLGYERAISIVQASLTHCGCTIDVDGVFGNESLMACNMINADVLLVVIRKKQEQYYEAVVAADETQAKFINGWRRRARS